MYELKIVADSMVGAGPPPHHGHLSLRLPHEEESRGTERGEEEPLALP